MTAHVPGSPITIVLDELVGCVVEFLDDEVVAFQVESTEGVVGLGSLAGRAWRASLDALKQRNPGRLVCLARPAEYRDKVPRARLRAFLRTRGWTDSREFELARVSQMSVQRIALAPVAQQADAAALVSVRVVFPDGRRADLRDSDVVFAACPSESARDQEVARFSPDGAPSPVPPGTLSLRAVSNALAWAFGVESVTVAAGEKRDVTIVARENLFRVRFVPTSLSGDGEAVVDALPFLLINTTKDKARIDTISFRRGGSRVAYLSPGKWSTTFFRDGCKEVASTFEVLPGDDQVVPVEFEIRRPTGS